MYRIELSPGEVTVFRTIEELATGVRNGLITPKARIYHSASEKWLPIEFHPHYKAALELLSGHGPAPSKSKPVERPRSEGLTFLNVPISAVTPAHLPPAPPGRPPVAPPPATHAVAAEAPVSAEEEPTSQEPVQNRLAVHEPVAHRSPPVIDQPAVDEPEADEPTVYQAAPSEPVALERVVYEPAYEKPRPDLAIEKAAQWPIFGNTQPALPAAASPVRELPKIAYPEISSDDLPAFMRPQASPVRELPKITYPEISSHDLPAFMRPEAPPALELPKISYPEITPAERPVAMRSSAASPTKRPLHLLGALVVLAVGGYASATFLSFGRGSAGVSAASTMADRPVVPLTKPAAAPRASLVTSAAVAPPAANPPPRPVVAAHAPAGSPSSTPTPITPADNTPLPPASSGFAPALEPRAIVAAPAKASPQPDAAADSASPPAIDMQVAVPQLQGAESLAGSPRQKGDSAMKKILRAVSAGKAAP